MKKPLPKTTATGPSPSPSKIDVINLLNHMDFVPDDVVSAAAKNAVYFVEAIKYRLECMELNVQAKMDHKRINAERALQLRQEFRDNGDKLTEDHLKALLVMDSEVSRVTRELERAEVFDEYSKLVVEGFRMRRDCLRIVSDMTRNEMGIGRALDSQAEDMSSLRRGLAEKFPGK